MAKRGALLTAAGLNALKPAAEMIELVDGGVPGLRFRLFPDGRRAWSLSINDAAGRRRRFQLIADGLGDARKKAEALRAEVRAGRDPIAERRTMRAKAKATAQGQGTLRALVDAYFTTGPGSQLKSSLDQKQRIFSVFGDVLDKAADEVRQVELQLAVDNWPAPVSAGRAVSYIYGVLKWAKRRDLIPVHIELEKPTPPVINQRYLNTDELPKVLPYLDGPYGRAARFLLLTATRVGELEDMTWAEVNFDTAEWVIVGERRKDTRGVAARNTIRAEDLTVPLSRQAIALLRMVEKIENERRAIMGLPKLTKNDRVFVGNRGGKLHDWDRYCKALVKPTGVPRWSAHAMRRTAATVLGHVGCPPHIIQVALGHRNVGGALVSRYAKSRYRAEHEDALQRLADYVDGVESGGAKIIPLVKKKVR